MNDEMAQRAVACKHWRWMPGMLAMDTGLRLDEMTDCWESELPDLDDPATLGCLLALVAEAHGVTLLDVHVVGTATGSASVWCVRLGESSDRLSDGPNKCAALVAALEAAP